MQFKQLLIVFLAGLLLAGCEKKAEPGRVPVINGFSPQSGSAGTEVVITGNNFGESPLVFFNELAAQVVSVSADNQIRALVPAGASSGKIKLVSGNQTCFSPQSFTVPFPPTISSFSPDHGGVSTVVTIQGNHFGSVKTGVKVTFNGAVGSLLQFTSGFIQVRVPPGASTGKIIIEGPNGKVETATPFTLDAPRITGLASVYTGREVSVSGAGHILYLKGENFSRNMAENQVKINGVAAVTEPHLAGNHDTLTTKMTLYVPQGVTSGKLTLTLGTTTVEYANPVTIAPGNWTMRKGTYPGPSRNFGFSFTIAGKTYVGGGTGSNNTPLTDLWEYDTATDQWKQLKDVPVGGRANAIYFSVGSKGYVGAGSDKTKSYSDLWEYDPGTDSWAAKKNIPYYVTTRQGFAIANVRYVVSQTSLTQYDPATDTWTPKAAFPGSIGSGGVGFAINGMGYLGTGGHKDQTTYGTKEFWQYNPVANLWTRKADFRPGAIRSFRVFAQRQGLPGWWGNWKLEHGRRGGFLPVRSGNQSVDGDYPFHRAAYGCFGRLIFQHAGHGSWLRHRPCGFILYLLQKSLGVYSLDSFCDRNR
jgi:hypothetical protein